MFVTEYLKEDGFLGFSFDGNHTSEFNFLRVGQGEMLQSPLNAPFDDATISVPGRDGSYYFGVTQNEKTFDFNLGTDGIPESLMPKLTAWINPRKVSKLILDESPYKYYVAKLASQPSFENLAFSEIQYIGNREYPTIIRKGFLPLTFVTYEHKYGFSNDNIRYEIKNGDLSELPFWALASGFLPDNYDVSKIVPRNTVVNTLVANTIFTLYNGGDIASDALVRFDVAATLPQLKIINMRDTSMNIIINNFFNDLIIDPSLSSDLIIRRIRIEFRPELGQIFGYGVNSASKIITKRLNIGGYSNHRQFSIYPSDTQVRELNQANPNGIFEALINPSLVFDPYIPSTMNPSNGYTFTEFNNSMSNKLVIAENTSCKLDNILDNFNGKISDINTQIISTLGREQVCFIVDANDFLANTTLHNFYCNYSYRYY